MTSPYAYAVNNPAMFYDIDGRDLPGWLQKLWDATSYNQVTTFSGFDSSGSPSSISFGGSFTTSQFTSFVTFLQGGGTGNYTFWTGSGATGGYNGGEYNVNMQASVGYNIKITGSMISDWNIEQARSRYHAAEDACSTCQDIKAMEKFLFIDVPMSFAGGELFSAGWKAAGIGKFLSNAVNNAYARIAPRILVDFSEVATPITKNSVIDGFKVSNHAWRKSGLGRGATEELVSGVINGAKEAGSVVTEVGVGKFEGNIIKVYNHQGVKVAIDETRNLILSIRPETGFKF